MWREIARFEMQLQRREFLTAVYLMVFFFLTFGYTSSGAVELVSGRGTLAKNAPWAIAHAMAGVTAFGQVITTMITATAVMRDVATRQQELFFTTRLTKWDYLAGRWLGALAIMLAVYAAIPVGLVAGTLMPWVDAAMLQPFDAATYVRPLLLLVLPNVLLVSALFFSAGALGRSFMTILLLGVGLVALWGTGVALARGGTAWGALLDPFGNAALEWATRDWSQLQRVAKFLPLDPWILGNRLLWLGIAAGALGWLIRAYRFEVVTPGRARREPATATKQSSTVTPLPAHPHIPGTVRTVGIEAAWILRWTLRERGFVTLMVLAALNALVNAWQLEAPTAGVVLQTVHEHARVFLILIATIYAGELVWRERDVRVEGLRDTLPVGTGALVTGRMLGVLGAQFLLVLPLLAVSLGVDAARSAQGMTIGLAVTWIGGLVFPFLAQLTLLSLLVHAVVQNKVAGHVVLIGGWVLAVAMDRAVSVAPWLRFANLPPYRWSVTGGFGGAGSTMAWWVAYWSAVAIACGALASAWWVRGVPPSRAARWHLVLRRLMGPTGALLALALVTAALTLWRALSP